MGRCNCQGGVCNCVVISGRGVTVTGAGTAASPYRVQSAGIGGLIAVHDTEHVDLSLIGSGTPADPYELSGTLDLALTDLVDADVTGTPTLGQTVIVNPGAATWRFDDLEAPAGGTINHLPGLSGDGSVGDPLAVDTSGTQGVGPLTGVDVGDPIYLDSTGVLRTRARPYAMVRRIFQYNAGVSQVWTPTFGGLKCVRFNLIGGGGCGGYAGTTTTNRVSAGGGGGGGGATWVWFDSPPTAAVNILVGRGGVSAMGGPPGPAGGATTLSVGTTTWTAEGGQGGQGGPQTGMSGYDTFVAGGAGGAGGYGTGTGGGAQTVPWRGGDGRRGNPFWGHALGGEGGRAGLYYGPGGIHAGNGVVTLAGQPGSGFGGGGSGAVVVASATAFLAGGTGANGGVIVEEFY